MKTAGESSAGAQKGAWDEPDERGASEGDLGWGIPSQSLGGEKEDGLLANRELFSSTGRASCLKAKMLKLDYLDSTTCVALPSQFQFPPWFRRKEE